MRLQDRVALITGAATGLGKAAAIRLASEGAIIEILDIKDAGETCQEIRKSGGKAESQVCDVTDEARIGQSIEAIEKRHGRIDILVNNAGILTARKPWHTLSK
ncbi:MAG: SDR family NAD(P)-dependent oxidoreductase, partial [Bryobacteraceae bacterium]